MESAEVLEASKMHPEEAFQKLFSSQKLMDVKKKSNIKWQLYEMVKELAGFRMA